jgi:thiol-disulfide isomerase/thioredoxin
MKIYIRAIIVVIIIVGIFAGIWWEYGGKLKQNEGSRFDQIDKMEADGVPVFQMKTTADKDFDLTSLKGKIVIVNFWASWCGPCVEEIPSMIKLVEHFKGDVQLVAVSADYAKEDIPKFLKSFPGSDNPNIHIIWDNEQTVAKLYNIDRLPESFVVGKDLKLKKKIIGTIDWYQPDAIQYIQELLK